MENTRDPLGSRVPGVSIYELLKEVRVYISGNAGLRYEYPYVGCLAAVEGGSLYIRTGDLYGVAIIELGALDLVLVLCFRSGTDCEVS